MRKLMTAAALVACAGAGTVLAPTAATAANPPVQADQLILCGGGPGSPLNVTVENLTYDSAGPVPFSLTGCQTIIDGNPTDYSQGTPLSSTYKVSAQPVRSNYVYDSVTVTTSSGATSTYSGTDSVEVRVNSLEGVQVTFVP